MQQPKVVDSRSRPVRTGKGFEEFKEFEEFERVRSWEEQIH
jgi:hypothetical protein